MSLQTLINEVENLIEVRKSKGNFGHAGVPGHRGGSAPKGSSGGITTENLTNIKGKFRQSLNYLNQIPVTPKNSKVLKDGIIKEMDKNLSDLKSFGITPSTNSKKYQSLGSEEKNIGKVRDILSQSVRYSDQSIKLTRSGNLEGAKNYHQVLADNAQRVKDFVSNGI